MDNKYLEFVKEQAEKIRSMSDKELFELIDNLNQIAFEARFRLMLISDEIDKRKRK